MAEQTMQIDVTAEDVWLLPGWQNSDADHWQSRWEQRHGYRRLVGAVEKHTPREGGSARRAGRRGAARHS